MTSVQASAPVTAAGVLDAADIGLDLASQYRCRAADCYRSRGVLNDAMVAFLEGRGGTVEDFDAWNTAHRILGQEAADALECWAAVISAEGIA